MTYIVNDNGTDRPMTETEIAAYEAGAEKARQDDEAAIAALNAKAAALASARAKLAKLGLTDDELEAFLGV